MKKKSVSRRSFIKSTGAAVIAVSSSSIVSSKKIFAYETKSIFEPVNRWPGRSVLDFNENAVEFGKIKYEIVKDMIDQAIMELTSSKNVSSGWENLFPEPVTVKDKIAIKVNNSFRMKTCWQVMKAVVEGLESMLNNNYPAENITLYDRDNWSSYPDFEDNFRGIRTADQKGSHFDNIVGREYPDCVHQAKYLIDIPVLKNHPREEYGKVSLAFKSHIGTYDSGHKFGTEGLIRLNEGVVKQKRVLTIIDAIKGTQGNYNGSEDPFGRYASVMRNKNSGQTDPCTLILSTDPATAENLGRKIYRIEFNDPVYGSKTDIPLEAQKRGLGIGTEMNEKWDYIEIVNGKKAVSVEKERFVISPSSMKCTSSINKADNSAVFSFSVPDELTSEGIILSIFSNEGKAVYKTDMQSKTKSYTWNLSDMKKQRVTEGKYIYKLLAGSSSVTGTILVK